MRARPHFNTKLFLVVVIALFALMLAPASAFASTSATQPMHRLYNPNSGEHFYTADDAERDHLVSVGWNPEGEGWIAPRESTTPVYRFYNPNAGDHHYTPDGDEAYSLLVAGWNYEGVGWYSDDARGIALYREYNPNAQAGSHNYTTDASEHAMLTSVGWNDEGYAWYGVDMTKSAIVKVAGYDEFVITLDDTSAPITTENFRNLVKRGYYNGLAFYRIVNNFCLQGGTKGNTASGHDPELTPIKGEFSSNNVNNPLADNFHRGTVAMARAGNNPDSATSAFFVTLASSLSVSTSLNGKYAAFGTISQTDMKIVDAICSDYIAYATGPEGAITDFSHMPIIESISIAD